MDIERIAEECNIFPSVNTDITLDELALFAQKIREARDAEWMAEPFGYREYTPDSLACYFTYTADTARSQEPLFAKPKEVK
jgi:hypothetical protein